MFCVLREGCGEMKGGNGWDVCDVIGMLCVMWWVLVVLGDMGVVVRYVILLMVYVVLFVLCMLVLCDVCVYLVCSFYLLLMICIIMCVCVLKLL